MHNLMDTKNPLKSRNRNLLILFLLIAVIFLLVLLLGVLGW
ncbi:MAG: hypothetical protein QW594_02860 [Candidatus Woesearchaeota archaeon]